MLFSNLLSSLRRLLNTSQRTERSKLRCLRLEVEWLERREVPAVVVNQPLRVDGPPSDGPPSNETSVLRERDGSLATVLIVDWDFVNNFPRTTVPTFGLPHVFAAPDGHTLQLDDDAQRENGFTLTRRKADGTLDRTFGNGGTLTVVDHAGNVRGYGATQMADGKIEVRVTWTTTRFVKGEDQLPSKWVFNADGTLAEATNDHGEQAFSPVLPSSKYLSNLELQGSLQAQYGFRFGGSYHENYLGLGEKWLQGRQGDWFTLTPDGQLSRWNGGASLTRIATLDTTVFETPEMLQGLECVSRQTQTMLTQLENAHGFRFAGNYWENSLGRGEKWFQDSGGTWFIITPDGTLSQANSGTVVATLNPVVWDNPALLFETTMPSSLQSQLAQLGHQYGFHDSGDYCLGYHELNAKWFQDRDGKWYALFADGSLKSWQGVNGEDRFTLLAVLIPAVYADPQLLFQAPDLISEQTLTYYPNNPAHPLFPSSKGGTWFLVTDQIEQWRGGSVDPG